MHIALTILALVVWAILQFAMEKHARDTGQPLLTRKQLKYMRRKARQTGTTVATVDYKPRPGNRAYPIFHKDWLGPDGKPLPPEQVPPPSEPTQEATRRWGWVTLACIVGAVIYLAARPQQQTPAPPASAITAETIPQAAASSSRPLSIRDGRTKQGANVRAGPSNGAAVLRTVAANTSVRIIEVSGGWIRVSIGDAPPIGWVHGSLIE